jgi:hypothetical protein
MREIETRFYLNFALCCMLYGNQRKLLALKLLMMLQLGRAEEKNS